MSNDAKLKALLLGVLEFMRDHPCTGDDGQCLCNRYDLEDHIIAELTFQEEAEKRIEWLTKKHKLMKQMAIEADCGCECGHEYPKHDEDCPVCLRCQIRFVLDLGEPCEHQKN